MNLDYAEIGKRIAKRRKELGLRQYEVEERADMAYKYLSNIERGVSIPSTEVIIRLADVLETTPDEFLIGTTQRSGDEHWRDVAEKLRGFDRKQLALIESFIDWVKEHKL